MLSVHPTDTKRINSIPSRYAILAWAADFVDPALVNLIGICRCGPLAILRDAKAAIVK
jgi:hypothetical protein